MRRLGREGHRRGLTSALSAFCEGAACPAPEDVSCPNDTHVDSGEVAGAPEEITCAGLVVWGCGGALAATELYLFDEATGALVAPAAKSCGGPYGQDPPSEDTCPDTSGWRLDGEATEQILDCLESAPFLSYCYE